MINSKKKNKITESNKLIIFDECYENFNELVIKSFINSLIFISKILYKFYIILDKSIKYGIIKDLIWSIIYIIPGYFIGLFLVSIFGFSTEVSGIFFRIFYYSSIEIFGIFDTIHPKSWAKSIIPKDKNFYGLSDFIHGEREYLYKDVCIKYLNPLVDKSNNIKIYGNYAIIFTTMAIWYIFVNLIFKVRKISFICCKAEFCNENDKFFCEDLVKYEEVD